MIAEREIVFGNASDHTRRGNAPRPLPAAVVCCESERRPECHRQHGAEFKRMGCRSPGSRSSSAFEHRGELAVDTETR